MASEVVFWTLRPHQQMLHGDSVAVKGKVRARPKAAKGGRATVWGLRRPQCRAGPAALWGRVRTTRCVVCWARLRCGARVVLAV